MPRRKRIWIPNMCHHVMMRGVNGTCTFKDDEDRIRFLLLLQQASEMCTLRIHAFCLMSNHVHLLIEPGDISLSVGVHRFSSLYAQHFNTRHDRKGYLFQGRFRSILVEDGAYLQALIRYIHLNPVHAKLVSHPQEYQWSSYNAYLSGMDYTWLCRDHVFSHFGTSLENATKQMKFQHEARLLDSERKEIEVASQVGALGSTAFIEYHLDTDIFSFKKPKASEKKCDISEIIRLICKTYSISFEELEGESKSRSVVEARGILARVVQLSSVITLEELSKKLQKRPSTLFRLAKRIYDNPHYHRQVQNLVKTLFSRS